MVRLKVKNLAQETSTITTITQLDEIPVPTTAEELAAAEAELAKLTTETGGYSNYTSTTDSSRGLLGVINNLSIDHNLANSDAGVIEKGINTIIDKFHLFEDIALLRRELVSKKKLKRTDNGSEYWKV